MQNRSIPSLLGDLVENLSTLFRKEIQLARAEVSEKVSQGAAAIGYIAAGAILLLAALMVLLNAAIAWLTVLGVPVEWSALGVGVVVALIGYGVLRKGMSDVKAANFTPKRTVDQLQRDAAMAKEQVR